MTHTNLITRMKGIIQLSEKEIEIIEQLFVLKKVEKNNYFLKEGEICKHLAFINKGIFRYYLNHDGDDKIFSFGYEGCFMSNYESLLPQTPSEQNIQALEDAEILIVSYENLQKFYTLIPNAERFGRMAIEYVFIDILKDLRSFYTDTEEKRYHTFLERYPEIQQRIPQYHIASYVGVKPQSLSRIRKRMNHL